MKQMQKQIRDILEQLNNGQVSQQDIKRFTQEIIQTFRIYLEERDNHQWGDKFDGVGSTMRRAKSFDAQHLESEVL